MLLDYAYFALWFLVAHALAPAGATTLTLENERHPEQRMHWVRADDGAWAMTVNGRELGRFRRIDDAVVHDTGVRAPDVHAIADLVEAADLQVGAIRIRLRGQFAPAVLDVRRDGPTATLRDASRRLTVVPLRLRASNPAAP
jgi:hypothetical protein